MRNASLTRFAALLGCLLALAATASADTDDPKPEKELWVTAYTRQENAVGGGKATKVYFCGRAAAKQGSPINIFLRFKGRIFKATRVQVGRATRGFSQAKSYIGARGGGVNFGGYIGPIDKMALGEWEVLCQLREGTKSYKTSFSLIVGSVEAILKAERKLAAKHLATLRELGAIQKQIKVRYQKYESTKEWTKSTDAEWLREARPETVELLKRSQSALRERSQQLAPLFPLVQVVLTQMPLKLRDLSTNYHKLLAETRGGKAPGFDREAVIKRLDDEISYNLKRATESLRLRESTDQEGFYLDLTKFVNLMDDIRDQAKKAKHTSTFHAGIWNTMVTNADRSIGFLDRKIGQYAGTPLAKENPDVLTAFGSALTHGRQLLGVLSDEMYSKHGVRPAQRLEIAAKLPSPKPKANALWKEVDAAIAKIREIADRGRVALRKDLLARYQKIMGKLLELIEQFNTTNKKEVAGFEEFVMGFKNQMSRLMDRSLTARTRQHTLYYPTATDNLTNMANVAAQLAEEMLQLFKVGKKGKIKLHGQWVEYDRDKMMGNYANSAIRSACNVHVELELKDTRAIRTLVAQIQRLGIKLDKWSTTILAKLTAAEEKD